MDNIVGRLQKFFSNIEFNLIVGSILGDGRLECRSKGIRKPITARLRIHHGADQKQYVIWKYEKLKRFISTSPKSALSRRMWKDKKIETKSWYFHTLTKREFGMFYQMFYVKGVKVLPSNFEKILTPQALAVWFMDDGSFVGNGYTINCHCFRQKEQERIIKVLESKLDIKARSVPDRDKWKIFISRKNAGNLEKNIVPHLIPIMRYKLL